MEASRRNRRLRQGAEKEAARGMHAGTHAHTHCPMVVLTEEPQPRAEQSWPLQSCTQWEEMPKKREGESVQAT
jgi:hypothetical protein